MLKLIRAPNEIIRLYTSDGVIEVTICRIKGQQVRIGFEAPPSVTIVRDEIDTRVHAVK